MSAPPASTSAATQSQTAPLPVSGLKALLREFERMFAQKASELEQFRQNRALLREFGEIHQSWERRQIYVAEDFNILRTMRLTTKELCHSASTHEGGWKSYVSACARGLREIHAGAP